MFDYKKIKKYLKVMKELEISEITFEDNVYKLGVTTFLNSRGYYLARIDHDGCWLTVVDHDEKEKFISEIKKYFGGENNG